MNFETFEDIIAYAIQKEIEAVQFYNAAADQEKYADAKSAFKEFAEEEQRHVTLLENISKSNVEHYKLRDVPNLKRSDYTVDMAYEPGMMFEDILKLAAKREEMAFQFYTDLGNGSENPEHKKLFQTLAQEEAKHKLKFETILDDHFAEMGD